MFTPRRLRLYHSSLRLTVALALLVLSPLAGCTRPAVSRHADVVIVLVDTLRADRLGVYGNADGLTPFLDELAGRAHVFERAYAASSWTNPSVASLFTSQLPSKHRVVTFNSRLEDGETTLAEVLSANHYATAAFVANYALRANNGFAQGFDAYEVLGVAPGPDHTLRKQGAAAVNARVFRWLDAMPRQHRPPVFLYVHYMEPHVPYAPSEAALDRVLHGRPRPDVGATWAHIAATSRLDDADVAALEAVYDAEVAALDDGLHDLLSGLAGRGVLDDAVFVFTADHGDEFLDHAGLGHGHTLYDELIRVPLLIVPPGDQRHVDAPDPVSLIDVAPTVLDLVGVPRPAAFDGRSLRPIVDGRPIPDASNPRPVYSELHFRGGLPTVPTTSQRAAIVLGHLKLIAGTAGEREAYDLARDPRESSPLAADDPARRTLEAELARFTQTTAPPAGPPPTLDAEVEERLRALGYVH